MLQPIRGHGSHLGFKIALKVTPSLGAISDNSGDLSWSCPEEEV
jgi:hypothetical protein